MRRYTKSLLSFFLSVTILLSICAPGITVSATTMPNLSILTLVPDGEVSDSGYLNQVWIDEDGNKVDLDYTPSSGRPGSNKVTNIPSYYSSKDAGYCSGVRNQGSSSVCWAFSAVAAAEISLIRQGLITSTDRVSDLSEAHLAWFTHKSLTTDVSDPTFGDGTNIASPYSSGGDWHRSTFSIVRGAGLALEKDYPFYPYSPASMGNYDEEDRYDSKATLDSVCVLPADDRDEIKKAIMENGSVSFSAAVYTEYVNGNAYYQNVTNVTNHQMVAVGWDDSFSVKNFREDCRPSSAGAWLVKNSYDTTWGDSGYFWISYEDPSLSSFVVQKASLTDESEKTYQYDGFGYGSIMAPKETIGNVTVNICQASIANVFTAEKNESISSVAFYTEQPDVSYEIAIYKNVTYGADTPIKNGEKFPVTTEGCIKYNGYHKISLDQSVPVSEGESFAVVITMSVSESAGSPIRVPFEGKDSYYDGYYNRYYSSEKGQSYYTFPGYAWSEASTREDDYRLNNFCIKAFTVPDNTLEITTAEEFNAFAERVANGETFEGKNINLKADIDFGGGEIMQVGTEANPFGGYFLGNGYILKNGVINSSSDYVGVFSYLSPGGEIRELGLENVSVSGIYGVGALCGINEGLIHLCYSTGSVSGEESVGGLVGINCGKVSDSYSIASVSGDYSVGSFIGEDDSGEVSDCYVLSSSYDKIGNAYTENITALNAKYFSNGLVAYHLDKGNTPNRTFIWTKRDGVTTFLRSDDEKIYKVDLFDKTNLSSIYLYVNSKDNLKELAEAEKEGYTVTIYADSKLQVPYESTPTSDVILYVVWEGGHICGDNLTFVEGTPADCYNDGILSYYECICGKFYADENAENEIESVEIPALSHPDDSVVKTDAVIADCTTDGNIEYYTCTCCGDVFIDEECTIPADEITVSATGHSYSGWVTESESDCENDGLKVQTCANCGDRIEDVIPATGHSYSDWVTKTESDCENDGLKVQTCANCGDRIEEVIPATGHSYSSWVTESESDCESDGLKVQTCANCGDRIEEVIPATGHSYGDWVTETESDCENDGLKVQTCSSCGDRIEEVIPAAGHSYSSWVTETESDCENDGLRARTCSNCGDRIEEIIPAAGHSYKTEYIEPTETTEGYTIYECTVCGDSYISDYIDPITNVNFSCTVTSYLSDTDTVQIELIKRGETEASYTLTDTGKNCEFTFENILSGAYTVRISKYGHAVREYTIIITDDMEVQQFEIWLLGDVNGDGQINVQDYAKTLKHIKRTDMLSDYAEICADINGNGIINVQDYARILKHVKKVDSLW